MLYFTANSCELTTLETLPEIFSLEETEGTLFTPFSQIENNAGIWFKFFDYLLSQQTGNLYHGSVNDIVWLSKSETVTLHHNDKVYHHRLARWITITIGDNILTAALIPQIYHGANHSYAEYRFVVGCSDEIMVPIVMLYRDQILQ